MSPDGRLLHSHLTWKTMELDVIVIYAPAQPRARKTFWSSSLRPFVDSLTLGDKVLLLGDFNFTHDANDRSTETHNYLESDVACNATDPNLLLRPFSTPPP